MMAAIKPDDDNWKKTINMLKKKAISYVAEQNTACQLAKDLIHFLITVHSF